MRTILFLVRKEFLQIFRDRATVFQIFAIPVVQLVVLAHAATFEVKDTRLWVVDQDRTPASREVVARFAASGRFVVRGASLSMEPADEALLGRDVAAILRIPPRFASDLGRAGAAPVQLVLNAEQGAAAGIVRAQAVGILAAHSASLAPPRARAGGIDLRTRGWYNAGLDYKHYMVPGILVALVTIIGTLLTAQNIAREKELGTLEQLNVTPITRTQFVAGKLLPFWLLAFVDLAIGLVIARMLFEVPMRGSIPLVFGVTAVYLVAALGMGLLISTVAETQQQAMFVTFFVMLIYLLLGGIFTPVESMPRWVQLLAELNPVKHFVLIMRRVLMRGAGFEEIQAPFYTLCVFGAVVFALAVNRYSKTGG